MTKTQQVESTFSVSFVIPGRIGGWKRAGRSGKQSFTPAKMRSDAGIVKHFASQAMNGVDLLEGPLRMTVHIWRQIPKSWPKKKRGAVYITGTPDWDNSAKLIGDALNGVVYRDDAQIADGRVIRKYMPDGAQAGEFIRVVVEELA